MPSSWLFPGFLGTWNSLKGYKCYSATLLFVNKAVARQTRYIWGAEARYTASAHPGAGVQTLVELQRGIIPPQVPKFMWDPKNPRGQSPSAERTLSVVRVGGLPQGAELPSMKEPHPGPPNPSTGRTTYQETCTHVLCRPPPDPEVGWVGRKNKRQQPRDSFPACCLTGGGPTFEQNCNIL